METKPQTRQSVIEIELVELEDAERFRFVARLANDPNTRFVGSPFTMPRTSVAGLADDESDLDARVRLGELDTALTTAGWHDVPERGEHWWSLRYTRS